MKFVYEAYERGGAKASGVIEAESATDAKAELSRRGLFVTAIGAEAGLGSGGAGGGGGDRAAGAMFAGRARLKDLAEFSRQMAVLVGTGTPVVPALGALERQTRDERWRSLIAAVRRSVEEGETFAGALARHPRKFDAVTRSLVAAGEASGRLDEMLRRLAELTRQQQRTRGMVLGAMAYPAVLSVIAVLVLLVMLLFVVPRFATMFTSLGAPMPATTQFLLDLSGLLRGGWWALLPVLLAAIGGVVWWVQTPAGRRVIDRVWLRVPVFGPMARSLAVARVARVLGVLVQSRVPMLDALSLARDATPSHEYRRLLARAAEDVTRGEPLASSFLSSPLITPSVAEAVRNAEASGRVGDVLSSVADHLDEDNAVVLKSLTSVLEPLVLMVLGVIVGFVAISMFLPMFDLSTIASGPAPVGGG